MITNERQYKITKSKASEFKRAIDEFNFEAPVQQGIDSLIVQAQLDQLESEYEEEMFGEEMFGTSIKISTSIIYKTTAPTMLSFQWVKTETSVYQRIAMTRARRDQVDLAAMPY